MSSYFDPNLPDVVARSLFMKYDTDNSGGLGATELLRLFIDDLGLTQDQAQTYLLLLDTDGDADVSYEEFVAWLRSGERLKTVSDSARYNVVQRAVDLFQEFDRDGSGALDWSEFRQVFLRSGGKANLCHKVFRSLDKDNNGVISFQEFMQWLNWVPTDNFE